MIRLSLGLLLLALQGCASPSLPLSESLAMPASWEAKGGSMQVRSQWWKGFGDPVLDALVAEALDRNLDLRLAVARLDEAHALSGAAAGALWPSIAASEGGNRSKQVSEVTLKPYLSNNQAFEVTASYEVDVWGRVRDMSNAARSNERALRETRDSVALSISASVASGYVTLRAIDDELALAHRTAASRDSSLAIARSRQRTGYGGALESAQAEAELRATTQAIPQLELAQKRQEQLLMVLLGRTQGSVERGRSILQLPPQPVPAAGVPSELLRRRPDIASAESQVAAADAQLAATRARLLPTFDLAVAGGEVTSTILHGDPFSVWSLGGSILAPIFNGGELQSLADASAARRTQALIAYQKVVLVSLTEVETQLTAFYKLQAESEQAQLQVVALDESLRIATRRYAEGYSSYLDQLLAERNLFSVQQNLLQLHADTLIAEISVYRALGGGWEQDADPAQSS